MFLKFILKIGLLYDKNAQSKKDWLSKRENQVKKSGRFCPQITTAQIGLTTQERQNQVEKK